MWEDKTMAFQNRTGVALLDPELKSLPETAPAHGRIRKGIAIAGVTVYSAGLLVAMLGTAFAGGDWRVGLLTIPHALLAALFAGGSMGMALLAADPYVAGHGEAPATPPDFD
jgi:hypothetical protein